MRMLHIVSYHFKMRLNFGSILLHILIHNRTQTCNHQIKNANAQSTTNVLIIIRVLILNQFNDLIFTPGKPSNNEF